MRGSDSNIATAASRIWSWPRSSAPLSGSTKTAPGSKRSSNASTSCCDRLLHQAVGLLRTPTCHRPLLSLLGCSNLADSATREASAKDHSTGAGRTPPPPPDTARARSRQPFGARATPGAVGAGAAPSASVRVSLACTPPTFTSCVRYRGSIVISAGPAITGRGRTSRSGGEVGYSGWTTWTAFARCSTPPPFDRGDAE